MKPVIAIVGRPNVGKSTLFNRLTNTRDALVIDRPGVTRDRQFGIAVYNDQEFILIDTAGLGETNPDNEAMIEQVEKQTFQAVEDADAIIFLVDGRDGLSNADVVIAAQLRPFNKKCFLAINKTEGLDKDIISADFFQLGMNDPYPVSAQRGSGLKGLMEAVLATVPGHSIEETLFPNDSLKVSVIGRPNVGKSTLINRMLGEERLVTFDHPGTTRDSVAVEFERDNKQYVLIDTAGVRRRSRVTDKVEKFSVVKSLQTIGESDIVIMVMDAHEAITDQDSTLLGACYEQGKALIIAVNKWDGIEAEQRNRIKDQLKRKLSFLQSPIIHFISALHGTDVGNLFNTIDKLAELMSADKSTAEITDILQKAIQSHQPPMVHGRRIKLRYAHLGGHNPLRIIVHGNQTASVPKDYTRYLANYFQKHLNLPGIPVLIQYKYGDNPYKNKKNVLSKRQIEKKRRLMRHVKKK